MSNNNFDKLLDEYLNFLTIRNMAASTIKARRWKLNKFINFLEKNNIEHIDEVTPEIIRSYQSELYQQVNSKGAHNSVSYQNNLLISVKQFTMFLAERNFIMSDPAASIQYAKEPKRLPKSVLTPSEARKIIKAPDTKTAIGYRDRVILEVLYSTGIRKSELNNLKLDDVDYEEGYLRIVAGKGGKDRMVPLGKIASRYMENYIISVRPMLVRGTKNRYLFLSLNGTKLSKNVAWDLIKKYAKKAEIKKNVYPHTFRHTCATVMLKNKADIVAIRDFLGHESLKTTQVYTHLSITDLKKVHRKCHPRERDEL